MSTHVLRGHVRRVSWKRLSRGLYVAREGATPTRELEAWSRVLPRSTAFTHLTAAELSGWWLPEPVDQPVFAAARQGDTVPHRAGLFVCRHSQVVPWTTVDGVRLTTPPETLLAAARDLGVLDLVILGDSALRLGQCTLAELEEAAAQRRRGAPMLRRVLPLLDPRSESAWESVMRVLHRAAEIPVEPQHRVYDAEGNFVARGDLWIVGTRRLHEYDGAFHLTPEAQREDLRRQRSLVMAEWERMGYTRRDLLYGSPSIITSADALLSRPWEPRRLAAWSALVRDSLFSPYGRARAQERWKRAR